MEPGERSEEEEEDTQSSGGGEDGGLVTPLAAGTEKRVGVNGDEGDSEDGETSDSASSNSSSTTTGSSSSSGVVARSPGGGVEADGGALMQTDDYGDHFHVNCAGNAAKFYLNRFARGSIGRCVLFRSRWITPNEFQAISGRQSSKDWKRSIRLRGRCLKEYITQGLFQEHLKTCACQICSGEASEHLRLEGEMALAAKRRRLSQADGGSMAAGSQSSILSDVQSRDSTHSPTHLTPRVGTKRRRGRGAKIQRVWSPSGEVAQEMSGEDEEEEEGEGGEGEGEDEGKDRPTQSENTDIAMEYRRRTRRSAHRKHVTGYRTELGTFARRPRQWDIEEVTEFLNMHGFGQYSQHFRDGEVDGESMFLLKEHHLVESFGLKLGPALKLMDTIGRLLHPPA